MLAVLDAHGCSYEGDVYEGGTAWFGPGSLVFFLPEPELKDGKHWFDADVIDDNLANRWVGFVLHNQIDLHP